MLPLLPRHDPAAFPDVRHALRIPNGLLAVGGDLSPERLEQAYRRGIFPWFGAGDPILWWSPDPRTILFPERPRIGRSLRRRLRRGTFGVTLDRAFGAVIHACARPAPGREDTWIVPEMIDAYERLHARGLAHSVEAWTADGALAGGLYGVAIGRVFFGESMFSRTADASKVALVQLCRRLADWEFGLIDCQMRTDHLARLGAIDCPRADFTRLLAPLCAAPGRNGSWDDGGPHVPAVADRAEAGEPEELEVTTVP